MNVYVQKDGNIQTGDYRFRKGREFTNVVFIITERCNFRCSYCLGWNISAKNDTLIDKFSVNRVVDDFRHLQENSGQKLYITLTGGEPSLIAYFGEFVEKLTYYCYIELQTNLCTKSIKDFANRANPERVGQVMATYHEETVDKSIALEKLYFENFRILFEKKFTVVLKIIALPERIFNLERKLAYLRQQLPEKALILVQPFINWQYPYKYNENEQKVLRRVVKVRRNEIFDYIRGGGKFPGMECSAGSGFIVMNRSGNIYPCYSQLMRGKKLGNLIERNVQLFGSPQSCPVDHCGTPFWGLWYGVNPWDYMNQKKENCQYCRFA